MIENHNSGPLDALVFIPPAEVYHYRTLASPRATAIAGAAANDDARLVRPEL